MPWREDAAATLSMVLAIQPGCCVNTGRKKFTISVTMPAMARE
jgi:hypothetical protein